MTSRSLVLLLFLQLLTQNQTSWQICFNIKATLPTAWLYRKS